MLMTVGPWKPISLHTYQSRISDLYAKSTVSEELAVNVNVTFSLSHPTSAVASVMLKNPEGEVLMGFKDVKITNGQAAVSYDFSPVSAFPITTLFAHFFCKGCGRLMVSGWIWKATIILLSQTQWLKKGQSRTSQKSTPITHLRKQVQ